MAVDRNPSTPLRRSRRGQPLLKTAVSSANDLKDHAGLQTHDALYVRPTRVEDLSDSQVDKLQDGELDIEDFETRFYDAFERNETVKLALKVYGKGKRAAKAATCETYKIGDTVLVETAREPSVAVITAIWKVVGGEEEEYMNVALHWFLKPNQLASIRARRNHLENELYYSLDANATVPVSMIISHCTVSGNSQSTADMCCLSAIDARRGLYYEFEWDELHSKALEVPDFWDCRDQWDLNAQDIVHTPARHRIGLSHMDLQSEGESSDNGLKTTKSSKRKSRADEDGDESQAGTWAAGRKRKLGTATPSPAKKARSTKGLSQPRPASPLEDEENVPSESSGDESDEYAEKVASESESEDELIASESEPEDISEDDDDDDMVPRTPRKRRSAARPRTPRTPRTPRNKGGRAFKLAAPTPHSKAALRARASRKRTLAVRPPPLDRAHDLTLLENIPKDPWLRAMHVLHVASRPDALPCREEEYGRVLRSVEQLLDEGSGGCVYISGVPGTGKTATVHAVVRELKRMAEEDEGNPFTYVEINGLRIPEPSAAYGLLWEAVSGHDVTKDGHLKISAKEALKQLSKHFSASGRGPGGHACVVLMDELDQLMTTKQDVVYNFFNWPTLVGSKLVVLAVANTMDLPERVMTGRVRSRLGMVRINFQPYTREQLIQIVSSRLLMAKMGMPEDVQDVIAPDGVKFAAMKVSNISGDARRVLDICRRTVELVHPRKRTARTDDVNQVVKDMQNSPTAAYLRELSYHERVMLAAVIRCVRKEGVEEIKWGEVMRQHVLLTNLLGESEATTRRPTPSELSMVLESLSASRALLYEDVAAVMRKAEGDRRVILNLEHSEVERVLGDVGGAKWRSQLNC